MHTNQSLFNLDGTNAFYDEKGPLELSPVAYIAGIMKNAKGFCAVTNPLVNSYKRLVAGYEAPVYVAWVGLQPLGPGAYPGLARHGHAHRGALPGSGLQLLPRLWP